MIENKHEDHGGTYNIIYLIIILSFIRILRNIFYYFSIRHVIKGFFNTDFIFTPCRRK